MNRKAVSWLAIAALAVVIAAVWADRRSSLGSAVAQQAKVWPASAAELNQIDKIRIARGDGSQVTLVRSAAGWQVMERQFAADAGKIRKLLLDLTELEIVEEKTSDPKRYAVLGIDAPSTPAAAGTLIELFSAGKPAVPAFALIAGKSAGAREMYARRTTDKQGLLLRPSLVAEALPTRWLDNSLLDIKAQAIRQLEARFPAGPGWTLSRAAPSTLDMTIDAGSGRTVPVVDKNVLTGLLGSFANLTFDDLRTSTAPAAAAEDRLVLTTFDGLTVELAGLQEADKRWLRITSGSNADATRDSAQRLQSLSSGREFEIASWKYDAIFRKRDEIAPMIPRG